MQLIIHACYVIRIHKRSDSYAKQIVLWISNYPSVTSNLRRQSATSVNCVTTVIMMHSHNDIRVGHEVLLKETVNGNERIFHKI